VKWPQRSLDGKCQEETHEQQFLHIGINIQTNQCGEIKCPDTGHLIGHYIKTHERSEHE
jgi:hypothetical protein